MQEKFRTGRSVLGRGAGTYSYRARGCNAAGCGPYSSAQSITVSSPVPSVPGSLSISKSMQGGNFRYTATWSSVSGATSYEFSGGGRSYTGPNLSYQWTEPQVDYDPSIPYYVRACNANGCSGWRGPSYAP